MRLKTTGFKGRDIDLELGKLNVLFGPNGSGKTTAAQAIQFAALGYVPALGKRPSDTGRLMRGRSMSVSLTLDDGREIHREIERLANRYATKCTCSWLNRASFTEHDNAALRVFGREQRDVEECLDIRALLEAKDVARAERLKALLSAGVASTDEKVEAVGRLMTQRLSGTKDDRMPEDWRKLYDTLPAGTRNALKPFGPTLSAKMRDAGVDGALEWANDEKRATSRGIDGKTAARRELAARLQNMAPPKDGEIEALEAERDRLNRETGRVAERLKRAKSDSDNLRRALADRDEARKDLADAKAARANAATPAQSDIDALQDQYADVCRDLEALERPGRRIDSETGARDARRAAIEAEIDQIDPIDVPDVSPLKADVERLRRELEIARSSPFEPLRAIAEDLRTLAKGLGAVKYRAITEHSKTLYRIVSEHAETDPAVVAKDLAAAEKQFKDITAQRDRLEAERLAVASSVWKLRADIDALNREAMEALEDIEAEYTAALVSYEDRRTELSAKGDALSLAIRGATGGREALSQAVRDAEAAIARAQERIDEIGPLPAIEDLQNQRTELTDAVDDIAARVGALVQADGARREMADIVLDIIELEQARAVYTAAEWALKRVRAEELAESEGALFATVRAFLEAGGRREVPYMDIDGASVSFGWIRPDERRVPIEALSGGEWTILATSLALALISIREPETGALIVEAAEADYGTLRTLLRGIESCAGNLSAALVLTPHEGILDCQGSFPWVRHTMKGTHDDSSNRKEAETESEGKEAGDKRQDDDGRAEAGGPGERGKTPVAASQDSILAGNSGVPARRPAEAD